MSRQINRCTKTGDELRWLSPVLDCQEPETAVAGAMHGGKLN